MKVMYVAWGADGLLEPAFRKELAGIGVQRLQVNLDDDEVRVAQLRLSTYDEPIGAVVSVWTEEDPAEATSVLHGCTRRAGRMGSRHT